MAIKNGIGVQVDSARQEALSYLYVDDEWRLGVPHIYTEGQYRPVCIPEERVEVSYQLVHSDSYRGGWSAYEDNDIRQGYTADKRITGCMWFDNEAIREYLGGATIEQASLRLYAQKGVGRGVAVEVELCGTLSEYNTRTSSAPTIVATYGSIGSVTPGEVTTVTIPAQAVADLVDGKINALALYSSDTSYYNDRGYSKNYARFDGETSATDDTRPQIAVTALKSIV